MSLILSVAQFRVFEQGSAVPVEELILRAGAAVVEEVVRYFPKRPVLVLCGPGNNGKDGAVVAGLLEKSGWPVRVLSYRGGARSEGLPALTPEGFSIHEDVIIDAIFGIGLSRPMDEGLQKIVSKINSSGKYVVAVDMPSGINSDTGEVMGAAIRSDLTVTFSCLKFGHVISPGRYHAGEVRIKDIGLEVNGAQAFRNTPDLWRALIPRPDYKSHKYNRGYAAVCSVGVRSVGAVKLAALAALRIGSGAVAVACADEEICLYASALTAVMYKSYEEVLSDSRVTTLLIGPGGDVLDDALRYKVLVALNSGRKCVLDAGGISVFQSDPNMLLSRIAGGNVVMTPHEGEFKRVFPSLKGSVVERARDAARISGAIIVLKGHDTVIAQPDGSVVVNNNAPSSLATIGSGDVLAGIITGLIAAGMPEFAAACCGVWIHGECGKRYGIGLIADDIIQQIPRELNLLVNGAA
ncbi:NAD(P)H-hydrate dehydratase [Anaplasma marginale]|uniref:NAD(P)H-hydrate dehydratase n=1 Tax=Anaplasma marginale TaxID=770 RepID=UPI0011F08A2C|nr:NAD(P)H-hydrate dehydratase [Anaplasma marginale]TZF79213.1 NAD(P)H-hydrate dehydratase [Anaplasma marginale]